MEIKIYTLWLSEEASHKCAHNTETIQRGWMRLSEVLWDRLCSMSPDWKTVWSFVFACITNVYIHMGPLFASALQWKPQQCYRLGGGGTAASYTLPFIFSVFPLRLRAFDQSKVMFVSFAACVAITAVGELACLGGEKILALYLKQAKDKRSMAQFKPWIGGKSSQNIVGDYEQEIYA